MTWRGAAVFVGCVLVAALAGPLGCGGSGSGDGGGQDSGTVVCSDAGTCPSGMYCRTGRCLPLGGTGGSGSGGTTGTTSCTHTCSTGEQHSCSGPCADTCACAANCGSDCNCLRGCF